MAAERGRASVRLAEVARGGERALGKITAAVNAPRGRAWAGIEAWHLSGWESSGLLSPDDTEQGRYPQPLWRASITRSDSSPWHWGSSPLAPQAPETSTGPMESRIERRKDARHVIETNPALART